MMDKDIVSLGGCGDWLRTQKHPLCENIPDVHQLSHVSLSLCLDGPLPPEIQSRWQRLDSCWRVSLRLAPGRSPRGGSRVSTDASSARLLRYLETVRNVREKFFSSDGGGGGGAETKRSCFLLRLGEFTWKDFRVFL